MKTNNYSPNPNSNGKAPTQKFSTYIIRIKCCFAKKSGVVRKAPTALKGPGKNQVNPNYKSSIAERAQQNQQKAVSRLSVSTPHIPIFSYRFV